MGFVLSTACHSRGGLGPILLEWELNRDVYFQLKKKWVLTESMNGNREKIVQRRTLRILLNILRIRSQGRPRPSDLMDVWGERDFQP